MKAPGGEKPSRTGQACKAPGFAPVTVVPEAPEAPVSDGLIEIVMGSVSVWLTGTVDATVLRQILEVIRNLA